MFACIYIPNASVETAAPLLDCARAFSPRVENTGAGTVVFDVEGLERLFGGYPEIAEKISEQARTRGLKANVAVASNPDAALCAARGFDGVTMIERGTESARLCNLPVSVLKPPVEIQQTLERWGIRTLGAFAKLPPVEVSERLGQQGVALHRLAHGAGARTIVRSVDPLRFVEVLELDYEITVIEPLTFLLSRMLDHICSRLRARNLATHELRLALGKYVRILNLPVPVRNPRLLTKLFILDLEAHPPGGSVQRIEVEAFPTKPRVVQNGLFVPLSPEPEKLELTLARLKAIVGEENVGSPRLLDTHRPDGFENSSLGAVYGRAYFDQVRESARSQTAPAGESSLTLRIFRPPLEATVQLRNSLPIWIAFHGVHGSVAAATGPWRTSGDWWRPAMWDREEWDIEVAEALYRIYYDVHLDRWYAHGVYD